MKLTFKYLIICFVLLLNAKLSTAQINTIPGLAFWINGDSIDIVNVNHISKCYDLSPSNNHAIPPAPNNQPITGVTSINGHKIIQFDGIDDYLQFTPITTIRTVFWVIKENAGATSNYRSLLGASGSYNFLRGDNKEIWHGQFADNAIIKTGQTKIDHITVDGSVTAVPTNYSIISVVTSAPLTADNFTLDRNTAGRVWDGDLAELIIYNQALTPAQVAQVENYLQQKYTPTLNLGPDIVVAQSHSCIPSSSVTIQANPKFESYLWSTGNTSSQLTVTQYGEYSVICTDVFGVQHFDTIKVTPTPKNFNYPSHILCGNGPLIWNTQLDHAENTFQWQDNSTDSLYVITTPGQYYLTVLDSFGCTHISNTITVTQDNFASSVSLGPDVNLCAGNYITLTSGASSSLTYTWSDNSHNASLLITASGQYSVIVTNTNNCVATDTITVTVKGQAPIADFSTSTGCINSLVSFTNLSIPTGTNTIDSTRWNFGDTPSSSNTSTLTNSSHTYTSTGTYTASLKVITDVGCYQSISKTIQIYPKPITNFSVGLSCQNDNTAFTNLSTTTAGYTITSFQWNFGDGTPTSTSTSPQHMFVNQANYTIKLIATNNIGCKDSLISIIAVKPQVKADFTYSSPCVNTPTLFQDNSIAPSPAGNFIRTWDFGQQGLSATKTYTTTGVSVVTLSVTGIINTNLCSSKITKLVTIFQHPVANFTVPSFCSKDTVHIINSSLAQSGVLSSYDWKANNATFSTAQNPTITAASAGTYSVRLTVANSFGCKDSVTKSYTTFPLPIVDFITNPPAYYYINAPVSFVPTNTNVSSYFWNMAGITTSTLQSPTVTYNSTGTYTVSLNSQDLQGCKGSKTKTISVLKRYLDLAILNVTTTKDNDGFVTVKADLANYGSVPISSFDIHYQVSDAGNVKETWNGTLNPNSFYAYTFSSKSASQKSNTNNITCIEIEKVNGVIDENISNNDMCNTLNYDEISVSNPIPNPTESDITLPIVLNRDIEFSITIYNSTGQLLYEETAQKGIMGLNFVTLPTSSYARGAYIIKTTINDKVFVKKFIKISNN